MARKPEQRLWDRARNTLSHPRVWLQRIENGLDAGMPDIYATVKQNKPPARQLWIETKATETPVRSTTAFLGRKGLNQHQINWHIKAESMGVESYILAGETGGANRIWLVSNYWADKINEMTVEQLTRNSSCTDWPSVRQHLLGSA